MLMDGPGRPGNDLSSDVAAIYEYLTALAEQYNYLEQQLDRRLRRLEEETEKHE